MGKLDYLSKYADPQADKKKKKKKKSKRKDEVRFNDEDDGLLVPIKQEDDDEDEEDRPTVVPNEDFASGLTGERYQSKQEWQEVDEVTSKGRRRHDSDDEDEPSRKQRHDEPPRRKRHDSDEDETPRRKRHDSDDEKPSRRKRYDSENEGPPRRKRYDSGDDDEPPTKVKRYDSDDDEPAVKVKRHDSDDDEPPVKVKRHDSDDESPSRKRHDPRGKRRKTYDSDDSEDTRERMSSGHVAGLQKAGDFRDAEKQVQQKRREEAQTMVDKHGMGETVYRDELGQKMDSVPVKKLPQLNQQEQEQLNKGRVQKEQEASFQNRFRELQESTFARHADDHGLEGLRKDVIRKGDPMAAYAVKKKATLRAATGKPERPVYKGPAPKPNRFGIRPGYRWDGVDRGNGFEDKALASKFSSNHKKEQAYRWSTSDM